MLAYLWEVADMFLMIDNYDSFVYNLASYFVECGKEVQVVRNDRITREELKKYRHSCREGGLEGLIISPGPGRPEEGGISQTALEELEGSVPILGVCLGQQIIGQYHGAKVRRGRKAMHGKVTKMYNQGRGLFHQLPKTYRVTRYHSLVVEREDFPSKLRLDALAEDGAVMAISHRKLPVYGVQFHPEAVLTQYGHELIQNFINISQEWREGTWEEKYAD